MTQTTLDFDAPTEPLDWWGRNDKALKDARIAAIRDDHRLGRGTCSYVDETLDHIDILEALNEANIDSVEAALDWAYDYEGLTREQGLNASSGEPDCPLRASYREWSDSGE